MFEEKKTLIVVYTDELIMNQFRKFVETNDDTEGEIVGTKDDSLNIISWDEDVWATNKKAGNIKGKVLFLGNVKGAKELLPVIDTKFDEYGIKFGWAGTQAILAEDTDALKEREKYDDFLKALSEIPLPSGITIEVKDGEEGEDNDQEELEETTEPETKLQSLLKFGKKGLKKTEDIVSVKSEEILRNKKTMRRQMLYYGLYKMYYNYLEEFMNL